MAFKFEDDDLFAPRVKSGKLEEDGITYYWINGKAEEHSAFIALTTDKKQMQHGLDKAVWHWRCDEKGNLWYKGRVTMSDFHEHADHAKTRELGQLFLGIKDSEEGETELDEQIEDEVKNSPKASAA